MDKAKIEEAEQPSAVKGNYVKKKESKAKSTAQQREVHNAVTIDQAVTTRWVFPFACPLYAPRVTLYRAEAIDRDYSYCGSRMIAFR